MPGVELPVTPDILDAVRVGSAVLSHVGAVSSASNELKKSVCACAAGAADAHRTAANQPAMRTRRDPIFRLPDDG